MRKSQLLFTLAFLLCLFTINVNAAETKSAGDIDGIGSGAIETALEGFEDFENFVGQVMSEWKAPGIAIGIVKDGKPVYLKGFGYRDLAQKLPVTPKTLFCIASSTKSFTSTGLGILKDKGKVDWDSPIRECISWFRMKDLTANRSATIRDMLSHRTGLPAHTMMQFSIARQFNRSEIARRIQYLEPNIEFRTKWQYQNQMYQVATVAIEKLSGMTWEDFTRKNIFEPLGMIRSRFSRSNPYEENGKNGGDDDSSLYYKFDEDGVVEMPSIDGILKEISGAGSIHSTVSDMCNWLIMNLESGMFNGTQVVSPNTLRELHTSQILINPELMPEILDHSYTLGWDSMIYRGHKLLNRPGGGFGTASQVAFLPSDGIGVVILGNVDTSICHFSIMLNVFDRLLGLEQIPWFERLGPFEEGARNAKIQMGKSTKTPNPDAPPTNTLSDYTGEYENPGYGIITITLETLEKKELFLDFIEKTDLRHLNDNVFESFQLFTMQEFRFETGADSTISSIVSTMEPSVADIVFTRVK
jgi:CubicO group peptidase (beta-lactamase class C family)